MDNGRPSGPDGTNLKARRAPVPIKRCTAGPTGHLVMRSLSRSNLHPEPATQAPPRPAYGEATRPDSTFAQSVLEFCKREGGHKVPRVVGVELLLGQGCEPRPEPGNQRIEVLYHPCRLHFVVFSITMPRFTPR